jgi:hypothetical protein
MVLAGTLMVHLAIALHGTRDHFEKTYRDVELSLLFIQVRMSYLKLHCIGVLYRGTVDPRLSEHQWLQQVENHVGGVNIQIIK